MAVLTTLVRLLEVTLAELEGPGGTGPLEADVALLEGRTPPAPPPAAPGGPAAPGAAAGAGPRAAGMRSSAGGRSGQRPDAAAQEGGRDEAGRGAAGGAAAGAAELPAWHRDCVVYRAGQKRLARGYLTASRAALAAEMRRMVEMGSN
jgi:hypothetical protein